MDRTIVFGGFLVYLWAITPKTHYLLLAVKIGRPGYRVTKQHDQETRQRSLLFQVQSFPSFSVRFYISRAQ